MIKKDEIIERYIDIVDKIDELPLNRRLDYEEMYVLQSYCETILDISNEFVKKLQQGMNEY